MKSEFGVDTRQSTPRERVNEQAICDHQEEGPNMQNPRIWLQILLISIAIFVSRIFNSTIKNTFMEN